VSTVQCFVKIGQLVQQLKLGTYEDSDNAALYKETQKRELLKCIVAAMYSWQHCGTGSLSYRQPLHLVIMGQWNGQQRAVSITMFSTFGFLQFLLGFSQIPFFVYHLVQCVRKVAVLLGYGT
jgi:hypothetical protein